MFSTVALLTRQMKLVRLGGTSRSSSGSSSCNHHHHQFYRPLGMIATTTTTSPYDVSTTKTNMQLFPGSTVVPFISPKSSLSSSSSSSSSQQLLLHQQVQYRNFATKKYRKPSEEKSVKRQRIQARKKKNTNKPTSKEKEENEGDDLAAMSSTSASNQPFLQHQEWVKFQQSISVDGFQTGQTVSASILKKSSRGGKNARKRREKELERLQQQQSSSSSTSSSSSQSSSVVDLKYPAIRYSEEETRELLKLAYENRPPRAGKRGTRNIRRQARRWHLVRKIRSKYKRQLIAAHERRMVKRSWKRSKVIEMKNDIAPESVISDRLYQQQIMSRWAETMFRISGDEGGDVVVEGGDDDGNEEGEGIGNKTIKIKE